MNSARKEATIQQQIERRRFKMSWKSTVRKQDKFTEMNIKEFDLQPDAFSPRRQASIGQMRTAHFDVLELLNDLEDYTDGDLQQNEKLLKDTTTKEIESLIAGLNKVAVLLGSLSIPFSGRY